jgi:peroxiredoxin
MSQNQFLPSTTTRVSSVSAGSAVSTVSVLLGMVAVGGLVVPAARAQEPAPAADGAASGDSVVQARAIFNRAIDAAKNAQSISYMLRSFPEGDQLKGTFPNTQSEVQLARAPGGVIPGWRIRTIGSGLEPGGMDRREFDVAWLASTVEFVDHAEKKLVEKNVRDARKDKAFTFATTAKFDDFTTAKPYERELKSSSYTLEGRQEVLGVMCDVVLVELPGGLKTRWAFSVEDGLPRRVERILTGVMEGKAISELQEVRIEGADARLKPDLIRVTVPEGYTEARPAPKAPPKAAETPVAVPSGPETPVGVQPPKIPQPEIVTEPDKGEAEHMVDEAPIASAAPPVSASAKPPAATGPKTPDIAPPFKLPSASGGEVSLEALRGQWVVLEFSGSWCLPCRDSRIELDQLGKDLDGVAKVYTLTVREKSHDLAAEDYRKATYSFGLLFDADKVASAFAMHRFPSYVVITPDGGVAKAEQNYVRGQTLAAITTFVRERASGTSTGTSTESPSTSPGSPTPTTQTPPSAVETAPKPPPSPAPSDTAENGPSMRS